MKFKLKRKGEAQMAKGKTFQATTMTDGQTLTLTCGVVDAEGNPATLQAVPTSSLDVAAKGTLTADPTGLILTFKPATTAGELGTVTINITTVAPDPIITGSFSFDVTGSAAAGFTFSPVVT